MAAKPSNPNRPGMFPTYGSQNRGTNTVVGPNDASIGRVNVGLPGDPVRPATTTTTGPTGGTTLTGPSGGTTLQAPAPRTGGTAPAPPAPVTSKGVEGTVPVLSMEGPSAPMIHGPLPRFNGPIVRPIAAPSFGPGIAPRRGTPGTHPEDYGR